MSEVTPLFSNLVPATGEPLVPSVIAVLEKLLEEARNGEVRAIAVAYVDGGDCIAFHVVNGAAGLSRLIAAGSVMQYKMNKSWSEG